MKIYRVVYDSDGETEKEPGTTHVEVVRTELRYGANTIEKVWNEIAWIRNNPDFILIAIIEEQPAIIVLGGD